MTLTTHAAIGAALGSAVGNPILGFILGAISHFLVDMIPHGDSNLPEMFKTQKKSRKFLIAYMTTDAVIAMYLIMGVFLVRTNGTHLAFAAAVFGSLLPDLLVGVSDLWRCKPLKTIKRFHFFFHDFFSKRYGDIPLRYALVGQAACILLLFRYI